MSTCMLTPWPTLTQIVQDCRRLDDDSARVYVTKRGMQLETHEYVLKEKSTAF